MPSIDLTFTFEIGPFRGGVADITYGLYKIGRIADGVGGCFVATGLRVKYFPQGDTDAAVAYVAERLSEEFSGAVFDAARNLAWDLSGGEASESGNVPQASISTTEEAP